MAAYALCDQAVAGHLRLHPADQASREAKDATAAGGATAAGPSDATPGRG